MQSDDMGYGRHSIDTVCQRLAEADEGWSDNLLDAYKTWREGGAFTSAENGYIGKHRDDNLKRFNPHYHNGQFSKIVPGSHPLDFSNRVVIGTP